MSKPPLVPGFQNIVFPIIRAAFPPLSLADLTSIEINNMGILWKRYLYTKDIKHD